MRTKSIFSAGQPDASARIPLDTEWAYAAAIIDGEGCITIYPQKIYSKNPRNRPCRYYLSLQVGNTSLELLEWLKTKMLGGGISKRQWVDHIKHRETWMWRATSHQVLWILRGTRPYLIVKGAQADVGIEFMENYIKDMGIDDEFDRREALYWQMKHLNKPHLFAAAETK